MNGEAYIQGKSPAGNLELPENLEQMLSNEKMFRDVMDNLLEGLQIISFDWRYLYVNDTVVKQSKFTREELTGRTMMEIYPGIEHTEMFKTLSVCMQNRSSSQFENEFRYPDGSTGWFKLSMQPAKEGMIILSNDISAQKKAEKENEEYFKGLERLLFMTSHNLRQPIVQVQGIAGLLKAWRQMPEELDKLIERLEEPANALDIHTRKITGYIHSVESKAGKIR